MKYDPKWRSKSMKKSIKKSIENQWKWGPFGLENRCKIDEKSISNKPGFVWASRSCLRPQFGGSWAHLGSKRAGPGPFWAPSWGPKSAKIDPKSDLKCDQFFDGFEDRFLKRFGPILEPKTFQKWSQVGSKIDASWGVDLRAVLWWILDGFLLLFCPNMAWPK